MSYTKGKFGNVSDRDVAEIYANRQAADHCAYLIPHLKPTFDILDVGCGPGSITKGLAELCPQGRTLGVDFSEELIAQNKEKVCGPGVPNLSFEVANAEDLSRFADNSFDVVHAHAVIGHLAHPEKALKEFRRVCKPGGIVAAREAKKGAPLAVLKPEVPKLREFWAILIQIVARMGGNVEWLNEKERVQEAGFAEGDIVYGESLMDGDLSTPLRKIGPSIGHFTQEQLQEYLNAYEEWGKAPDRDIKVACIDVLAFKR